MRDGAFASCASRRSAPNVRSTVIEQGGVTMGFTNKNTAETQDFGVAVDRTAHLDDITVNFVSIRETHSLKDALAGLPDGNCKCPHWGYVLSGSLTVDYGDREETYGPGDARLGHADRARHARAAQAAVA